MEEAAQRQAASDPATPADVLAEIARHPASQDILALIAANPNADAPTLMKVYQKGSESTKRLLALCSHTPVFILSLLADDPDDQVRSALVGNPQLPPELLARLSDDPSDQVRKIVQITHHATPELLESLAQDGNCYIRAAAQATLGERTV